MSMVCQCGLGLAGGFLGGNNLSLVASMAFAFALPCYKFPALHLTCRAYIEPEKKKKKILHYQRPLPKEQPPSNEMSGSCGLVITLTPPLLTTYTLSRVLHWPGPHESCLLTCEVLPPLSNDLPTGKPKIANEVAAGCIIDCHPL